MEPTDLQLVRSANSGDDAAFHALVDRHAKVMFRVALSLSRNRADAEDLLQETLVSAFRGLRHFQGRSSVRTWLMKILTRQAAKAWRRSENRPATFSINAVRSSADNEGTIEDASLARESDTERVEQRIDLMELLRRMAPIHREILVLREMQSLSYDEIAEVLSVPRGTVESRLFRARAELRQLLEQSERQTVRK